MTASGSLDEALKSFNEVAEDDPHDAEPQLRISEIYREKHDLAHARAALGPYKRIRRIEFAELPKTISGKIRRVELRRLEAERRATGQRGPLEWIEEDFKGG